MTTVTEASQLIEKTQIYKKVIQVPLLDALGKVLQEDIVADRDFPPFNRVAMDGIAINNSLFSKGPIKVENIHYAGQPQIQLINPENCIEVMTGAVLPSGCDTVIRYEDIEIVEEGASKSVTINIPPSSEGENVHKKGSDRKEGDILISRGKIISPAEIAVAATVGKVFLQVTEQPKIALISTGDELVEPSETPLPHQIRRSNILSVKAALKENHYLADDFHLPDNKVALFEKINEILNNYDVLILSGGVSMGKADFVPEILEKAGVKKMFHKVAQRPGKPFWFGKSENGKVVFALPGNPVSTFVTFYKYCLPWLNQQMGIQPKKLKAVLTEDVHFAAPLTYFLQVKIKFNENGLLLAQPYSGKGSGDLANLSDSDGFLELPSDEAIFKAGSIHPLILFRKASV